MVDIYKHRKDSSVEARLEALKQRRIERKEKLSKYKNRLGSYIRYKNNALKISKDKINNKKIK